LVLTLASTDLATTYGEQHAPGLIRKRLTEARRVGYAVNPGLIVEGSWGMAAAVFGATGDPVGALSLTGVAHRFASDRQVDLGRLLLQSAHELSKGLNAPHAE
jgi:DNA-binding IclR family transcriptional regulator